MQKPDKLSGDPSENKMLKGLRRGLRNRAEPRVLLCDPQCELERYGEQLQRLRNGGFALHQVGKQELSLLMQDEFDEEFDGALVAEDESGDEQVMMAAWAHYAHAYPTYLVGGDVNKLRRLKQEERLSEFHGIRTVPFTTAGVRKAIDHILHLTVGAQFAEPILANDLFQTDASRTLDGKKEGKAEVVGAKVKKPYYDAKDACVSCQVEGGQIKGVPFKVSLKDNRLEIDNRGQFSFLERPAGARGHDAPVSAERAGELLAVAELVVARLNTLPAIRRIMGARLNPLLRA